MSLKDFPRKLWVKIRQDFDFNSAKPYHFYKSEWELAELRSSGYGSQDSKNEAFESRNVSLKYLTFRGLYMLFFNISITFSTACQSHLFHIFLTNWSFTAQNIYAILYFFYLLWNWWKFRKEGESNRTYDKSYSCRSTGENSTNSSTRKIIGIIAERATGETAQKTSEQFELNHTKNGVIDIERCKDVDAEDGRNIDDDNCSSLRTCSDEPCPRQNKLTHLEKTLWLFTNVVHVLPYCVVLGYWVVVYKYDQEQPPCEKFRSHFIVHGVTAVLAFLDTMIVAIPARLTHCIISTGLLCIYVLFTYLYELSGGPYRKQKQFIYAVLDWRNQPNKAAIFGLAGILISPLAHTLFCFGLCKLRLSLVGLYIRLKNPKLESSKEDDIEK